MTTHRIAASQLAWLNNYDGSARLALKVQTHDAITVKDGDHIYITVEILQGKLSLSELSRFVAKEEEERRKKLGLPPPKE